MKIDGCCSCFALSSLPRAPRFVRLFTYLRTSPFSFFRRPSSPSSVAVLLRRTGVAGLLRGMESRLFSVLCPPSSLPRRSLLWSVIRPPFHAVASATAAALTSALSSVIPALRSLDVGGCLLSSLARHSLSAKAAGPGVPPSLSSSNSFDSVGLIE
jgi:hypothetical protein